MLWTDYRDYLDASLLALVASWRRVLRSCPERATWEDRRRLRAWEAELAWRGLEV